MTPVYNNKDLLLKVSSKRDTKMEFNNHLKNINKLQERCELVSSDIGQILSERKENLEKRKQLEKRLEELQQKIEHSVIEETVLKNKVDMGKLKIK